MNQLALIDEVRDSKRFFRIDEPVIEGNQFVVGGMFHSQRKWWLLQNFVRLLVGGYGSGKSIQLAKRHIALCLAHAPIPTAIVSPTYAVARKTVVLAIEEILTYQSIIRKKMGQKLTWTQRRTAPYEFVITWTFSRGGKRFRRKGTIIIYSGEMPDKLKGTNLGSAGIDEPFIQELAVFEQMVFRVRHRKAKAQHQEVNLTGTPESMNWGFDLAEGELSEKYDVGVVQVSTRENKALSPDYVQRLEDALDPRIAKAYIEGQFINLSDGLVYYAFDRTENVVDLPMPPGAELGAGMDFNVNPMAAAVFWVRRGRFPHIHYFDEIELPNSDTPDMCRVLKDHYAEPGTTQTFCNKRDSVMIREGLREVYPDASGRQRHTNAPAGKSDYNFIEEAGFNINSNRANPGRRDRYNAQNAMYSPKGGRVRCTVSPRCKKIIKYASTYEHALMNLTNQKRMSHLLDAKSYPTAFLFPVDRVNLPFVRIRGV